MLQRRQPFNRRRFRATSTRAFFNGARPRAGQSISALAVLATMLLTSSFAIAAETLGMSLRVEAGVGSFTVDLAGGGLTCDRSDARLECIGFDNSCNNAALRLAGIAAEKVRLKEAAWASAVTTFRLVKDVVTAAFPQARTAAEVADILIRYFDSATYSDLWNSWGDYIAGRVGRVPFDGDFLNEQVGKNVAQWIYGELLPTEEDRLVEGETFITGCGNTHVSHMLRPIEDGQLRMTIGIGAECTAPAGRLKSWRVLGGIDLAPVITSTDENITMTFRPIDRANYRVESVCD